MDSSNESTEDPRIINDYVPDNGNKLNNGFKQQQYLSRSSEDDNTSETGRDVIFNKFDLLNLVDGDDTDLGLIDSCDNIQPSDCDDDDASKNNNSDSSRQQPTKKKSNTSNNRKKNKKKRGKNHKKIDTSFEVLIPADGKTIDELSENSTKSNSRDVLDGCILNGCPINSTIKNKFNEITRLNLLKIELRNLIPDKEFKRMFGRKTIESERSATLRHTANRPGASNRTRMLLVEDKNAWHYSPTFGLSMQPDEDRNNDSNRDTKSAINVDEVKFFKFVHGPTYQFTHYEFLDAVGQGEPSVLLQILTKNPCHCETLIQLSEFIKMSEDYKTASEFLERALYVYEKAFHPSFILTQARCRLEYRRPENRSFFIAIFKHMNYLGRRGLRRTPLEFNKLLLSLDPEGDPLFSTLTIDFYAIRSEEYDYLIEFSQNWSEVSELPNFQFSISLAYFLKSKKHKGNKSHEEKNLAEANKHLKLAITKFPSFVGRLLEACKVEPDQEFKKCRYFSRPDERNLPEPLDLLIRLYVSRTYMLYKDRDVIAWIEGNVSAIVKQVANNEIDKSIQVRVNSYFVGASPRNLLRHIILSDLPKELISLPASATSSPILDYDPFPPPSPIVSYTRPAIMSRHGRISFNGASPIDSESSSSNSSTLRLFLRSMIPSFSSQQTPEQSELNRQLTQLSDALEETNPQGELDDEDEVDGDSISIQQSVVRLLGVLSNVWTAGDRQVGGQSESDQTNNDASPNIDEDNAPD